MKGLQLPLGVQLSSAASFETYFDGPNAEAVAALRAQLDPTAPPLLLVYGAPGSGKTHLLQALTASAAAPSASADDLKSFSMTSAAKTRSCAYLPLRQFVSEGIEALEGLHEAEVVCLDDIDAVLNEAAWPLALLRFLDRLRAQGGRCALSAAAPPERLNCALPDLLTRLSAAAVYGLKPFSDEARGQLLLERANSLGLQLAEDAARYLLSQLPRGTGQLLGALDALDRAALSAQRRLSLPFVQQWLRETSGRQTGLDS